MPAIFDMDRSHVDYTHVKIDTLSEGYSINEIQTGKIRKIGQSFNKNLIRFANFRPKGYRSWDQRVRIG